MPLSAVMLRMRPEDIVAPEAALHPAPGVKLAVNREAIYESFHLTRGGNVVPVEVNAHLFELYDKALVFAMARPVAVVAVPTNQTTVLLTIRFAHSHASAKRSNGRPVRSA